MATLSRALAPAFLLSLLAGCALAPPTVCHLEPVADLPVTLDHNRLEVIGRVNQTDTRLVIDTGSQRTVLTTQTVRALTLAHSQISMTRITGISGSVRHADVFAVLEIGGAVFDDRVAEADIPNVGGLVGADMLRQYDVEFDLPDLRFRLWHAAGCGANDLPWSGPRAAVAIDVTDGDRLRVPVILDGVAIDALLDSGAAFSLLRSDWARRAGVSQAALAADPELPVRGADGGLIGVRLHRFNSITVGGETLATPLIGVGGRAPRSAEMLLGVDYLRNRRVWVSYRTGQLFIQPGTPDS